MNHKNTDTHAQDELNSVADSIAKEALPSEVIEAAKSRILSLTAAESITSNSSTLNNQSAWMSSGFLRWSSSAALLVGLLTIAIVFSSSQKGAFAKMQEALETITTIQMTKASFNAGEAKPYSTSTIYIDGSKRIRTEEKGLRHRISIMDTAQMESIYIWPETNQCYFWPIYDQASLESEFNSFLNVFSVARSGQGKKVRTSTENGKQITEFEVEHLIPAANETVKLNIFVDKATNLPVKIIVNYPGPGERAVFDNLVFGKDLDPALFAFTPPENYEVNRVERADDRQLELAPDAGLGKVKLGMSTKEIEEEFGTPSYIAKPSYHITGKIDQSDKNVSWFYQRGFRFSLNEEQGIYEIVCGIMEEAQPFQGFLTGDIRIGDSLTKVEESLGKAHRIENDNVLVYDSMHDSTTSLHFTGDRLTLMVLSKNTSENDVKQTDK